MNRLLRGFALLGAATLFTQAVGFVAYAIAARELGPERFGAASVALSFALYFGIPANFGLAVMALRDTAREPERRREILGEVLALRVGLGIVCAGALALAAPLLASDENTRRLLPLAALTVVAGSISGEWALLGVERRGAVALARFAGQAAYGALVIAALGAGFGAARNYVLYTVLSILIVSVMTQVVALRAIGAPVAPRARAALGRRVTASAPFGLAIVMIQVYLSIGLVMLSFLEGAAAAGQFAVAQKIPLALYGLSDLWSATLFPLVARLMASDRTALREQVAVFVSLSAAIAVPLVVGGALVGDDLIPRLFGEPFAPAATAFAVLLGGLGLALVTVNFGSVLAAGGDERRYAVGVTAGAVLTLVLDAALIPPFGVLGAALAVAIAEVAILGYLLHRYRAMLGAVALEASRLARIVMATAVMAAVLVALADADVLVRLAAGAITYLVAAAALGLVPRDVLRRGDA